MMQGTLWVGAAALAVGVAGAADAHGPVRQKTEQSVEVSAPAAKVWAVIGNFQNMDWYPDVVRTEGTGGNDPDTAKRTITFKNGSQFKDEELTKYDADQFTYAVFLPHIDVNVLPVTNYSATIKVVPDGPDRSKIEWMGAFYRGYPNNDPPPNLNEAVAIKAVTALHQVGLDALKRRFGAAS